MTTETHADDVAEHEVPPQDAAPAETPAVNGELLGQPDPAPAEASEPAPLCQACRSPRADDATFCAECGFLFPATEETTIPEPGDIVGGRYQLGDLIGQRGPVLRFRGLDLGSGQSTPIPVVLLRESRPHEPAAEPESPHSHDLDFFALPLHDTPSGSGDSASAITAIELTPVWPGLAWERLLLARTSHLSLPRVLDTFKEPGFEYLVIEVPEGRSFWDAWDETPVSWTRRCQWLIQLAEALDQLHLFGAMLEGLRPDIVVVTPTGQAAIADLTDLLPVQMPANAPVRGSFYSAPELTLSNGMADSRADLYSFGAMIHALLLSRELTELDFEGYGVPRPYLERYPDGHPMLGRLLARTFVREVEYRFPSRDFVEADPTGFHELMEVLRACGHSLDGIRLEIAAWTNTGIVRSANEDAVAYLHTAEARLEVSDDFALLLLADGMGGMASGEVAAAMTIESIRNFFLKHPPFAGVLVEDPAAVRQKESDESIRERHRQNVLEALREANQTVFEASRLNPNQAGMGCTAEVVVIDGKNVVVGHVGDSRAYLLRQGKLTQITQDQTLVSQLVTLGQLTEEEAEDHPQRSELQQAVGGRKDVYPDTYTLTLEAGDWLLVCSDGLSNQLRRPTIESVMRGAGSAEKAARRLVNQAILDGASDNVSVVVVRVC